MTPLPCPAPDTALLYLVRHGATANNVARPARLQGRATDLPLSPDGERQAAETANFLSNDQIAAVYSSPLLRAVQTAESIALAHGLPPARLDDLIECDIGRWEGRSWEEIEASEPEAFRLFTADPATNPYAGGENLEQVHARVAPAIDRLLTNSAGKAIVVVAHNVVNRAYLAQYMNLPLSRARTIPQHNCGISLLSSQSGVVKLVTLNSIFHLS